MGARHLRKILPRAREANDGILPRLRRARRDALASSRADWRGQNAHLRRAAPKSRRAKRCISRSSRAYGLGKFLSQDGAPLTTFPCAHRRSLTSASPTPWTRVGRRAHADGEAVIQLQRLLLRGHGLRGRREALRGNGHDLRVARISAQRTRSSSSLRSDGPYPRGSLSGSSGERQVLGQWPREEGLTTRSSTQHHERAGHRYRAASLAARGARPIRPSAPLVTFQFPSGLG